VFDYADTVKNEICQIFSVGKVSFHIYSLIGIWRVISEMKRLVRHTESFFGVNFMQEIRKYVIIIIE